MTSVRVRTLVVGAALALASGLLIAQGDALGADLPRVAALGLAAGAVLGLVPARSAAAKLGALAAGYAAFLVGLQLLKSTLPDTSSGRAVAAVVVVGLVTAVAVATSERLPLWAGLLGVATLTGTFQTLLAAGPAGSTGDGTTVTTSVTTSLTAVAVGFLLTDVLPLLMTRRTPEQQAELDQLDLPAPRAAADTHVQTVEKAAR